jgi:protease PrsW
MNILLILIAVFPPIYFLLFFHFKSEEKKHALSKLFFIFFLGIIILLPVLFIELIIDSIIKESITNIYLSSFFTSFIMAASCEEIAKYLIIKKFIYNNDDFNTIMDGIIYTISVSLGFATLENLIYIFNYGLNIGYIRAFTAVPLHVFASGIMGYYIGKAKSENNPKQTNFLLKKGLLTAVIIHGLYNFFIFLSEINESHYFFNIFIFPLLIFSFIFLLKKINIYKSSTTSIKNKKVNRKNDLKKIVNIDRNSIKFLKDKKKNNKGYEKGKLYN